METKWGAAFRRNAYVAPKIELFAVEQPLLSAQSWFEGDHKPGGQGEDVLEAKEFINNDFESDNWGDLWEE